MINHQLLLVGSHCTLDHQLKKSAISKPGKAIQPDTDLDPLLIEPRFKALLQDGAGTIGTRAIFGIKKRPGNPGLNFGSGVSTFYGAFLNLPFE